MPKWVFVIVSHVLYNVLTIQFVEVLAVLLYPGKDCGVHCGGMLESLTLCELGVCCGISEMDEAVVDILVVGYSTRAKAFVSIRKQ